MKRFICILFVLALIGCGGGGGGGGDETPQDSGYIEILNEISVILSGKDQTHQIEARVYHQDGTVSPDAKITWSSDRPGTVSVDQNGLVTAKKDTGSALVTASYGDLQPQTVSVVIAKLAPDARLVQDQDIKRPQGNGVVLDRTPETEALQPGQILVSGATSDEGGLLDRILTGKVEADRVILTTEPVTMTEAFEDFDLQASGVTLQVSGVVPESVTGAALSLECGLCDDTGDVDVTATGLTVDREINLKATVTYSTKWFKVKKFGLHSTGKDDTTADIKITPTAGQLITPDNWTGCVECKKDLTSIPLTPIAVGPLRLSVELSPSVGVKGILETQLPALTLTGPQGNIEIKDIDFGFDYDNGSWSKTNTYDYDASFSLFSSNMTTDAAFDVKLGPFINVEGGVGVSTLIGGSLGQLNLLETELFGNAHLTLATPIDEKNKGYTGPDWDVSADFEANLKMSIDGLFGDLLDKLVIDKDLGGLTLDLIKESYKIKLFFYSK